jgi:hypothetical protein
MLMVLYEPQYLQRLRPAIDEVAGEPQRSRSASKPISVSNFIRAG